jgi:hypothetical protein
VGRVPADSWASAVDAAAGVAGRAPFWAGDEHARTTPAAAIPTGDIRSFIAAYCTRQRPAEISSSSLRKLVSAYPTAPRVVTKTETR